MRVYSAVAKGLEVLRLTDAVLSEGGVDGQHGDVARVGLVFHLALRLAHDRSHRLVARFCLPSSVNTGGLS